MAESAARQLVPEQKAAEVLKRTKAALMDATPTEAVTMRPRARRSLITTTPRRNSPLP